MTLRAGDTVTVPSQKGRLQRRASHRVERGASLERGGERLAAGPEPQLASMHPNWITRSTSSTTCGFSSAAGGSSCSAWWPLVCAAWSASPSSLASTSPRPRSSSRSASRWCASWSRSSAGLGAASSDRRTEEQRIAQIIGYVRSRPFLERVVKILKMTDDPTLRDAGEGAPDPLSRTQRGRDRRAAPGGASSEANRGGIERPRALHLHRARLHAGHGAASLEVDQRALHRSHHAEGA